MDAAMPLTYTAFLDGRRLTTGPLHEVAVAVLRAQVVLLLLEMFH